MTVFWLYAGLLCAAALAFILAPQFYVPRSRDDGNRGHLNVSLYRERLLELKRHHDAGTLDAAQLEAGRVEAARDLLDDARQADRADGTRLGRTLPLAAALATPLLALLLYMHWGSLDRLMLARQHGGNTAQSIAQITTRLEALLSATPDSAEGWSLLGRAYMAQERAADAARAFERAATLAGRPAPLLGRWAEALYYAGGGLWTPQLQALTGEALAGDPREAVSLKLRGTAAYRAGRYGEAADYWERLAAAIPADDPSRIVIEQDIARARKSAQASAAPGAAR
jgi:cytochrome c-type biogenesis protein CcmH